MALSSSAFCSGSRSALPKFTITFATTFSYGRFVTPSGDGSTATHREKTEMKLDRRAFLAGTAATVAMPGMIDFASAQEKVIRFAMPQDFTRVYTFVTAEYSQGQRDYITLVNEC